MLQQTMSRVLGKMSVPLGIIGAVGGFISDVMAPLFDFAPAVAGVSFAIFLISAFVFFRMRQTPGLDTGESLMPAVLVLSAGSAIIFSVWSVLFINAPDKGYLAENIDPIAQFQASLLGIEEDVEEIKETVEGTAADVEAIATAQTDTQETVEETAADVEVVATAQAQGFADIQAAFASLQLTQTIVENPTTPQEWYSNARIYQLKGDNTNAIASYEGYFEFGLEYVDPFQEYANLLNATQGIARTRQALNDLWNKDPDNLTLDMMTSMQLDTVEEQVVRLEQLSQRAPLYAPVFYELAQGYTRQLQSNFTSNLRERQAAAFDSLFLLEQEQGYSRYYIDKSRAQENLDDAQDLINAYGNSGFISLDFLAFYSYEGLTIAVILPEANTQELLFSLDDPTPSISTGKITAGDQNLVNTSIGPIPYEIGDHTLYIQYTDANGEKSEIFTYEYTIEEIVINFNQLPYDFDLEGIPAIFTMAVLEWDPNVLITFNFSIDSDALDQSVTGVPEAGVIQTGALEPGEHVLYVQAVGGSGAETAVIEFPFTIE